MADIRTLSVDVDTLETLRSELRYTERRLLARSETAALALPFQGLTLRWAVIRDSQVAHWDAEDDADVSVSNSDDDADDLIHPVSYKLLSVLGGSDHPVYARILGSDAPSAIQGLGLESQVKRMADWPQSLRTASPELSGLAEQVEAVLTAGKAALDERSAAASARADFRVNELRAFFEEVNGVRLTTFGQLLGIGASTGKPKNWAARFFRKGRKKKASEGEP